MIKAVVDGSGNYRSAVFPWRSCDMVFDVLLKPKLVNYHHLPSSQAVMNDGASAGHSFAAEFGVI
jgi:hypothetical protein